ncbi:phosphoserine phosphatase [Candidatus Tenderia electrophaga]|uniref:Histidinol-phosphatase n=1 Tax=Candidatus Tenderia electrophaga TaxID=1748243 RepID=A0A0S2THW0_9GAMM|nr:phosphoserine phosphatase [Candidatus Tenderia electrophaga]
MELAIFDLDNTLLKGDSDYLWGRFLVQRGIVDGAIYERENQRFYEDYTAGTLDIFEFLRFALQPLAQTPLEQMLALRREFIETEIKPIILPQARELINQHRDQGRILLIITATNRFVTEPIAELLGVPELLATDPEFKDGRYTGRVSGVPAFRQGKVERLNTWLKQNGYNLASSWFYSDSHNDLPLLELVTHPVAVDADDTLKQHAELKGWPVISLRDD